MPLHDDAYDIQRFIFFIHKMFHLPSRICIQQSLISSVMDIIKLSVLNHTKEKRNSSHWSSLTKVWNTAISNPFLTSTQRIITTPSAENIDFFLESALSIFKQIAFLFQCLSLAHSLTRSSPHSTCRIYIYIIYIIYTHINIYVYYITYYI